jgi:hypothetical protein
LATENTLEGLKFYFWTCLVLARQTVKVKVKFSLEQAMKAQRGVDV